MPIVFHKHIRPEGEVGIWKITESETFFRNKLELSPEEEAQIEGMIGKRKIEWLAGRKLLHVLSGRETRGKILKDEFGKPHLENSDYQISISHSHELVAVSAAPEPIGVDVQYLVEKIGRIAHKFVRPEEMEAIDPITRLEHLHVIWGAKECLYKAYGRKKLDFREHLITDPFKYRPEGGILGGWTIKQSHQAYFEIHYEKHEDYMLVYAIERR
ncbi:MAG: 4'-phosphopantetheinyl transferase superfamily protein [Bacteroidetes bacterium]|nr:4'-phosphopantetheinyl transferase superfamily protein [Bacteroidota bacterium]